MANLRRSAVATVAAGLIAVTAQARVSEWQMRLEMLTVPYDSLPGGCRLASVPRSNTGEKLVLAYPNITDNPWVGSDIVKTMAIRRVVEGPPQHQSTPSVAQGSGGDHEVVEAYRAVYLDAAGSQVDVYAVRFSDPRLAMWSSLARLAGGARRTIVKDTAVLIVSRGAEKCTHAITEYTERILRYERPSPRQ